MRSRFDARKIDVRLVLDFREKTNGLSSAQYEIEYFLGPFLWNAEFLEDVLRDIRSWKR